MRPRLDSVGLDDGRIEIAHGDEPSSSKPPILASDSNGPRRVPEQRPSVRVRKRDVRRSHLRTLMVVVAGCAAALTVLFVAFGIWMRSDGGRAYVARRIESVVSEEIEGTLRIGAITEIDVDGVHGRDISFSTASGREVLRADRVQLIPDWIELARGRFIVTQGRVEGGKLLIVDQRNGQNSIDDALESAGPDEPIEEEDRGKDAVRIERLAVSNIDIVVDCDGAPRTRIDDVSGIVRVRSPLGHAARVRADNLQGNANIDLPVDLDMRVDDGTFAFNGDARRRAWFDLSGRIGDDEALFDLEVHARRRGVRTRAEIVVPDAEALYAEHPALLQVVAGDAMTGSFDFHVREAPALGRVNEREAAAR